MVQGSPSMQTQTRPQAAKESLPQSGVKTRGSQKDKSQAARRPQNPLNLQPPKQVNQLDQNMLSRSQSFAANGQQTQKQSTSKRVATSEHGVQRPPRDPTLNKRLKSTFTNVGGPRQRVAKIPKGRDVPVDLLPVNKISKGTTMLKAGGSKQWRPSAGPSGIDSQGRADLNPKKMKKDIAGILHF